jgi:NIPSNAP
MIIDERTYTCHPGKVKAFLDVYGRLGKPIQWPIVGEPVGFFTTDTGLLGQVVDWWKYQSMADREQCPLSLSSAPGWSAYLDAAMPLLCALENRILVPTSFSPLK